MTTVLRPLPAGDLDHAFGVVGEHWTRLRRARVFLTGGTGFVGKWLLASLLEAERRLGLGCEVTVLSREPDTFRTAAPDLAANPCVTLLRGDVARFEFPQGRFSHVIHAATDVVASNEPIVTFDTCLAGTRRVLDFAVHSGASEFLFISSGAVYGRQPTDLAAVPESFSGAPNPSNSNSAYGIGKLAAEWLVSAYAAKNDLKTRTARCFAFVGPYLPLDKHFAIGNFLGDAMARRTITIQGDGTPYRSYLHAADMAAWLWTLLLGGQSGSVFNIGGPEAVSIAELARRTVGVLGAGSDIKILTPPPPGKAAERYVPDVSGILKALSLPAPITLDESLRRTAAWHKVTS